MTKEQIASVLERVQSWPKARQEDAARLLLALEEQETASYALSEEERVDLEAALQEVADGDVASRAEVEAVFSRYRK